VLGTSFLDQKKRPDSYYIDGFVDYLYDITDQLALPGLKKSGIQENALREIASLTDNKNNPVKLDTDDMTEILSERF
jgi:alcohol dehydrogenase class IV